MKKVFLAVLLVVGVTTFAQEGKSARGEREKLTTEQQVELQTKKMKLELDLNDKQTAEVKKIVEKEVTKREAKRAEMQAKKTKGEKPSKDEMFKMKNEMLDAKIAHKAEMKKILNADQYTKWEAKQSERKHGFSKRMKKGKREMKKEDIQK
jgi:periplasmic protein CpxP/Spy